MDELPGVIIALVIIYFVARYFRGGSQKDASLTSAPSSGPLRGVTSEMITTVTTAFPDVSPTAIVYSLSKTKSAQATVEQILEPRLLPEPPANFPSHPHLQRTTAVPSLVIAPTPNSVATSSQSSVKPLPSLIDRYNLSSKVDSEVKGKGKSSDIDLENGNNTGGEGTQEPLKWEKTAEDRQRALMERKQQMVLEARRRMVAKQSALQKAL